MPNAVRIMPPPAGNYGKAGRWLPGVRVRQLQHLVLSCCGYGAIAVFWCTPDTLLPIDEWENDAHSQYTVNPRFITMTNDTAFRINLSPATCYVNRRDYVRVLITLEMSKPYYCPGYKADFPDASGNCAVSITLFRSSRLNR